ncbi:MAG: hypothetical protein LBH70_01700 [Spirochaetaceae bacterium]|nr:hypothetical protein [Spirochaetaceae bacterium]
MNRPHCHSPTVVRNGKNSRGKQNYLVRERLPNEA